MNRELPPRPRKSLRLPEYDYSQPGAYFITICAEHRLCLFGQVQEGKLSLNPAGQMIAAVWLQIPEHYAGVLLDSFVAMPNHVHGIVVLASRTTPDARQPQAVAATGLSLPEVVDRYKTLTTKLYVDGVRKLGWQPSPGRLWQRSYYDHVVRNELELNQVREYISFNPGQWSRDKENPDAISPNGSRVP